MKYMIAKLVVIACGLTVSARTELAVADSAGDSVVIASGSGTLVPKQPQAAVGDDGSVHLVFGLGDMVHYSQSLDEGSTFAESRQAFRVPNLSIAGWACV